MKKEFREIPDVMSAEYCKNCGGFSWIDFVAGMPHLVFLVTGWKPNGKENACLQSWSTFVGANTDDFVCVFGKVNPRGHMYQSLKSTGCCVVNFPTADIYDRCVKTIENNQLGTDEITEAGLTAEPALRVNAPRVKECFLNIECKFLWEHPLCEASEDMVVDVKAVSVSMDSERYDQSKVGRYNGGYQFQIDQPTNPETGEISCVRTEFTEVK